MRNIVLILALLLSMNGAARAEMDLQQFLRSVEEASQIMIPLRGDGTFEVASGETTRRDQVAVILRPPTEAYLELHQNAGKWLLLSKGEQAYRLMKGATKAEEFPPDASFADSDFTREDLEPFRASHYKDARISDESPSEMTVTFFPKTTHYSLVVVTFDSQKKVPIKTLYYQDTLNNLVKMQRDEGYALIGRKWMPSTITMASFKLRTQSTLKLQWTQDVHFPPELFDPVFLTHTSGIVWPTATTTPAP